MACRGLHTHSTCKRVSVYHVTLQHACLCKASLVCLTVHAKCNKAVPNRLVCLGLEGLANLTKLTTDNKFMVQPYY